MLLVILLSGMGIGSAARFTRLTGEFGSADTQGAVQLANARSMMRAASVGELGAAVAQMTALATQNGGNTQPAVGGVAVEQTV